MYSQQQSGQRPPVPPPYLPAPGPRRRKAGRGKVVALGVVVAAVAVTGVAAALDGSKDKAPLRVVASSSPVPTSDVPTPTDAQRGAYLAALVAIDEGLVANPARAVRRGRAICNQILHPSKGGKNTLKEYVVLELSGGDATIDQAQAGQVLTAVRKWCR